MQEFEAHLGMKQPKAECNVIHHQVIPILHQSAIDLQHRSPEEQSI